MTVKVWLKRKKIVLARNRKKMFYADKNRRKLDHWSPTNFVYGMKQKENNEWKSKKQEKKRKEVAENSLQFILLLAQKLVTSH